MLLLFYPNKHHAIEEITLLFQPVINDVSKIAHAERKQDDGYPENYFKPSGNGKTKSGFNPLMYGWKKKAG
ncbi:MAG: hypothetical protein K0R26_2399 [Bacteroidota bacterium]|jgi:hypothetical protein|nr:hypothetical protein [Bacteroidota bacterium]